jgi:hypothetical protein
MLVGESRRIPDCKCTNCGKELSGAAGLGNDDMPKPGDVCVCLDCGHVMAFADDLTLRNLTDEEIVEFAGRPEIISFNKVRRRF